MVTNNTGSLLLLILQRPLDNRLNVYVNLRILFFLHDYIRSNYIFFYFIFVFDAYFYQYFNQSVQMTFCNRNGKFNLLQVIKLNIFDRYFNRE